jgi:Flp pilus assembly pilin Flp
MMQRTASLLLSLFLSENGGELIEYALLAALIAIAAIKGLSDFGDKHLLKFYKTIGSDLQKDFRRDSAL